MVADRLVLGRELEAEPLSDREPDAGTSRATGRPWRVVSISSPAAASSRRQSIFALATVAVTCFRHVVNVRIAMGPFVGYPERTS